MKSYTIGPNDAGQRLDKFITKVTVNLPVSLLYKAIRKKRVKINGKRKELSYRLAEGDLVELYLNDEFFEEGSLDFLKSRDTLSIVYEDENICLVNKPAGMVVHEDETQRVHTLISNLQRYLYEKGEYKPQQEHSFAPALCNRIDRNTSGLVIAAKNAATLRVMNEKLKNREIKKKYLCVTHGRLTPSAGEWTAYHRKSESKKRVYLYDSPRSDTKTIVTKYRVLRQTDRYSLVEVDLITGRTHQIRAHFAYMGYPLVGDGKYGRLSPDSPYRHQLLSSYKIKFQFSTPAEHLDYLQGKEFEIPVDFAKNFESTFGSNKK